ncbi:MAG: long-chain-fatty-acid--CoA ligase [Bacillota bacterium]
MSWLWQKHYEETVPDEIAIPDIPLHRVLEDTARKMPQQTATIFMGAKLTYKQINDLADTFAVILIDLGVKVGDRVAIHLPNSPQFVFAYYGVLKAGGIVVPTNPLYVERELESQLRNSGAEVILTLSKFYPLIQQVRARTRLRHVIVTNIKEYFPPLLRLLFTLLKEKKEGHRVQITSDSQIHLLQDQLKKHSLTRMPEVEVASDNVALLMFTGGTTGIPKGAALTHRNLLSNALQVRTWTSTSQEGKERILTALPMFHSYGLTTCLNMGVLLGATLVLLPQFFVKDVLKTINRYRPTLFPGVPTMYVAINNHPEVKKFNLRSITTCISGGAALPVEVQARFEEITGARLVEGYGLSETSPCTHCNPIFGLRKTGSIGVPLPNTLAKVVNSETAEELPQGEIGELAVKGPQVMKGYWYSPYETAAILKDGWLFTGDMARMDEEGYFYIVDRKKDMIIAGGYNIYPREIEEVLYTHPKIREAVVAAVPDEYRGETVKAYIVLKDGQEATAEEIIEFCRNKMAKYKLPRQVEFRDDLPKSMIGKVLRRLLVEEESRKAPEGNITLL